MKEEKNMLISTIIPVYNGARYISEAIQSILDQDYPRMEILVVDDGSTDDTARVVRQFEPRVSYVYQENAGIAATMNQGLRMAKGDYLAFLDSDDYWLPGKISTQWNVLQERPELDMVFSHVRQFYSPELTEEQRKRYYLPEEVIPGIHSGALLIRRNSFFKVGYFNEKWRKGAFSDWYMQAQEIGLKELMLPDVLYMRRVHDQNHGIVSRDKSVDYVRILREALNRRRSM